ncbi:MAG: glycogen synthase [Anaerolineales bacterium]|jgi:starch synthase
MSPFRVLFLSAEVAPFAKTGGLADVGGSLPKALAAIGHDVRIVMPAFAAIEAAALNHRQDFQWLPSIRVPMGFGELTAGILSAQLPGSSVPVYFISEGSLFNRPFFYGYEDDGYRFAFYSRAALELTRALDWQPDIVHANDWHTAPAVTWLAAVGQTQADFRYMPSLFTIHNLAHQGKTPWGVFDYMGIQNYRLNEEKYNEVNFMARGIHHATLVNTVSPTYAREIMSTEGGAGLDGLLRMRAYDVHGILNGLDTVEWDPANDTLIASNFDADHLSRRIENKLALQLKAGLPPNPNIPLVGMISRLDWQKGLDITGEVIHHLMNNYAGEAQFVVLGTGDQQYHDMFTHLASYHSQKMTAFLTYDNLIAHLIYAGSDIFLMPSLFEPCGLGQMIAMHYGSVPVVRAVGGLADTVQDGVTGFTFFNYTSDSFAQALARAIYIYNIDRESWLAIQKNGMSADFSWQRSARGYQQLYEWAAARRRYEAQSAGV